MKALITLLLGAGISANALAAKPEFTDYVTTLKQEARQLGISEQTLDKAFAHVSYKPRAVKADRNQPEKRLTLDEYLVKALPDWRIAQAKALYKKHYRELYRAGQQYGVQPRFIVALWGIESSFGKLTGGYNIIDALSTLAYDGRREAFFRQETMAALTILDQGHIQVEDMKGSWAGAMGQCQFMPSSFLSFAQDGNGDGRKDIWGTKADVFASAANYLKQSGWDDTYTWGREVRVPDSVSADMAGRQQEKAKKLREWSRLGVRKANGRPLPKLDKDIDAWLIMPDDRNGRAYLIYNNYQVLMKWNRSYYFGLAVSHLADRIKEG